MEGVGGAQPNTADVDVDAIVVAAGAAAAAAVAGTAAAAATGENDEPSSPISKRGIIHTYDRDRDRGRKQTRETVA